MARHRSSAPLLAVVTAGALVVAAIAVGFAFTRTKGTTTSSTVGTTTAPPPPPSATVAPSATAAPPSTATAPPPATVPSAVETAAPTASAPPVVHTAKATVTAPPAPPPPTKPAATVAVDCSSPYTLDADGKKKWKLECLH